MMSGAVRLVVFLFIGGFVSVWHGQDANWDVANYLIYNPFAALNGRLGYDLMPAWEGTAQNIRQRFQVE